MVKILNTIYKHAYSLILLFQIDPVVDVLLRYDPDTLRVDFRVKEKCGVELAEEKGPAFSAVAVKLFHQGCLTHQHNRQEMIKFLAQRKHIGDYTVS